MITSPFSDLRASIRSLVRLSFLGSVFRSAGIYTISNVANAGVPFLLLPLLTRFLSPEDYGTISMFQVLVGVSFPLVNLNIHGAIGRRFVDEDKLDLPGYVGTSVLLNFFFSIFSAVVLLGFRTPIGALFSFPPNWLAIVPFFLFSMSVFQIFLVHLQMLRFPLSYALGTFLQVAMNAGLTVLFVVFLNWGWQGRILAQVIATISTGMVAFVVLLRAKWMSLRFVWSYCKSALLFGVPLIPHALAGSVFFLVDRVVLSRHSGLAVTGVYSVANQVGMIILMIESSVNLAWVPFLYEKLKDGSRETKISLVRYSYGYFAFLVLFCLALNLMLPFFLKFIVGKSFSGSGTFVLWLSLGYTFDGMYKVAANYLFYAERTGVISLITMTSAVVQTILTVLGVSYFGAVGAAYARVMVSFSVFLVTLYVSNRLFSMPWKCVFLGNSEVWRCVSPETEQTFFSTRSITEDNIDSDH